MIGPKNRRIAFWMPSGLVDASNEPLPPPDDFVFFKKKWANVRGETGMGSIRAAAAAGGVNTPLDNYSFRVNFDKSLLVGMQIREDDGTSYNVLTVRHDIAKREWTDVVAQTGGSNG